jgi:hypothetical protein
MNPKKPDSLSKIKKTTRRRKRKNTIKKWETYSQLTQFRFKNKTNLNEKQKEKVKQK